jgi:hypothetical protein
MSIKVGIVSPARDMVCTGFAFDAMNMAAFTMFNRPDIVLGSYVSLGTMIFDQRIKLVREAMSEGCDYILWLDTDMRFPKDTLLRLLEHKKDIVAANYVTRQIPPEPVSFQLTDEGKIWRRVSTQSTDSGLEKVSGAPMGVMLCNMEVFRKIDKPDVPMFWFQYSTKNHTVLGEDIYFCINAGRYGFEIFIDHDLSKQVHHVGTFEFGHEHVDDIAAAQMRKDLDAAVITDLNKASDHMDKEPNAFRVIKDKPAPVIPLAVHVKTPPYVGAEGIHKDIIADAINREQKNVAEIVNITGAE